MRERSARLRAARATLLLAIAAATTIARAAPCAGFGDVVDDGADGFCPSVEWMKNRSVTSGCGDGSNYCPSLPVDRLALAAIVHRLGDALGCSSAEPGLLPRT